MKPRSLLLAIDIAVRGPAKQQAHADRLHVAISQVNQDLKALEASRLLGRAGVDRARLYSFLVYGVSVVFPAKMGARSLGIPTSITARLFDSSRARLEDIVWPSPSGDTRGSSVKPLYATVPKIALEDQTMYRVLAAIDALRIGEARDVSFARSYLEDLLVNHE